jgi:toxin CcdB
MAQFDVHRNPHPETRDWAPYLLVLQHDLLGQLRTAVVAPLVVEARFGRSATTLNPVFEIEGRPVVMSTAELAGISRQQLGEHVQSLRTMRDEIRAAIDLLIRGI